MTTPSSPRYVLFATTLATLVASGSRFSFAAFVVPIELELGASRAFLSAVAALTLVSYGICQPLAASVSMRLPPARVMIVGLALLAGGGWAAAATYDPLALLIFLGLLPGVGFAFASVVPATALLMPAFPTRPGTALGVVSAAIPAGQALLLPAAIVLIAAAGWRTAYVVLGGAALLVAAPPLLLLWHRRAAPPEPRGRSAGGARADPLVIALALGFAICGFTDQLIAIHLVPLAQSAGLAPLAAGGLLSALTLVGIAGSVGSGPLADLWSARATLVGVYLVRALALPLVPLALWTGETWPLWVFAAAFGLTYIANHAPAIRLLRARSGPAEATRRMGWLQLVHQLGGATGVLAGGASVALAGGYAPVLVIAAALAAAAALVSLRAR